jgi:hypothetical protein
VGLGGRHPAAAAGSTGRGREGRREGERMGSKAIVIVNKEGEKHGGR